MGEDDFTAALETFSAACDTVIKAEQALQLVSQQKFIESLQKLWKRLPKDTKDKINKTRKVHRRSTKKTLPIVIPAEHKANITSWLNDRSTFFNEKCRVDESRCPISRAYKSARDSRHRRNRDELRIRFYQVLFYHLKVRFGVEHFRDDTASAIARIIHASNCIDNVEVDEITNDIMTWAKFGKKYNELCWDFAEQSASEYQTASENQAADEEQFADDYKYLGPIFYLPCDVTERSLKDIPDTGGRRHEKIETFIRRGILEVENREAIDTLVGRLFSRIWMQTEAVMNDNSFHTIKEWRQPSRSQTFKVRNASARKPSTTSARPYKDIVSPSNPASSSVNEELTSHGSSQYTLFEQNSDTFAAAELPGSTPLAIEEFSSYEQSKSPEGVYQVDDPQLLGQVTNISSQAAYSPGNYQALGGTVDTHAAANSVLHAQPESRGITLYTNTQRYGQHTDTSSAADSSSSRRRSFDPDWGFFDPDQYGWDGFHRFDADQHGQPGYYHFDPTLFGLDAMPNKQPAIAASTHQIYGPLHARQPIADGIASDAIMCQGSTFPGPHYSSDALQFGQSAVPGFGDCSRSIETMNVPSTMDQLPITVE